MFLILSGMNYLHYEAPVPVIHRDLKSKNGEFGEPSRSTVHLVPVHFVAVKGTVCVNAISIVLLRVCSFTCSSFFHLQL